MEQQDTKSYSDKQAVIAHVKRHPIGLLFTHGTVIAGYLLIASAIFYLLPDMLKLKSGQTGILVMVVLAFGVLVALFLLIESVIYRQNELLVTQSSVTEVTQRSLFNRETSRIDMEDVEDVTSHQGGIIQSIFNYGTLIIETAGEQHNFKFTYCPNPSQTAKIIHDHRQKFNEHVILDQRDNIASSPQAQQPQQNQGNPFDRPLM